ncbi:MAG: hypothetical protein PVH53_03170 [Desulfobacterales bacterium]|jgi:hypothetical protein
MLFLSASVARGDDLPSYCQENPALASELSSMGPVMGMGSSVSHGLLARSASEIVADQLCLGSDGHVFPWYFPASYQKAARYYYKRKRPGLVLALDVTYHDMKVLEYTSDKKKVLDTLVAALALDCESDLYDCSEKGNESYVIKENYKPTVLLGDLFFEKLIDCTQGKPPDEYRLENVKPRPKKLCYEEYARLNRHLMELAAQYPNVHIISANRLFTALVKYPNSIFYDEGTRQTFFARNELTWDGWHPYTDPGSYVLANLTIMQINRLIGEGKIKGRRIPLRKLSDKYFGPPSGLIISVPDGFPAESRPQIVGPEGRKTPLRFSLSKQWAERHGVFSLGKSYFRDLALSWDRLGPKPLIIRAEAFRGTTLVLSKKDQENLSALYRKGTALKGGLLLWGQNLNAEFISREDAFFLNQIEENPDILNTLHPPQPPQMVDDPPWDY